MAHKKSIWKLEGLDKKAAELIQSGVLKQDNGLHLLCESLNGAFAEALGGKKAFSPKKVLDRLVWTSSRLSYLKDVVTRDLDLTTALEHLSYLPEELVKRRAAKLRGHRVNRNVHEASAAGLGRMLVANDIISSDKAAMALPEISLDKPFKLQVRNPEKFSIVAINGPSIGLLYGKVLDENPLRCALRQAEVDGDDVVVVTGGLMSLDVKKSQGHLTTHRALLSGINYDPAVMDPEYRPIADKIRKDEPPDQVGFETLRERVLNLMHGFNIITTNADGSPVFSGITGFVFSHTEEEIIEAAAHYEALYITTLMRDKAVQKRMAAEASLRHELKESKGRETKETKRLKAEIAKWRKIEKRYIQSNVMHVDRKRFVAAARAWLVQQFESNIPNCRVLAQGSVVLKAGDQRIEVYQDRNISATEGVLDDYLLHNAGRRSLENTLPEVVLLANPFSINGRWGVRERMGPKGRTSTHLFQLPITVDKDFIRESTRTMIRKVAQLENVIRHPQFEPGVTRVRYTDGVWSHEQLTIGNIQKAFTIKRNGKASSHQDEYSYFFIDTDNHTGHPWREEHYDAKRKLWVGHVPAVMRMITDAYPGPKQLVPIHGFFSLDDQTQGHHFPTQAQPHQQVEPFEAVQEHFNALLEKAEAADTPSKALDQLRLLQTKALEQIRRRGVHWPELQVEEYCDRVISDNIGFFAQVIKRSRLGKVHIKGVGELLGNDYDSRDAAIVSFGSGNHFGNTVDDELTEGFIYAREVRNQLKHLSDFKGYDLKRLIRNPLFGNTHVGWGRLQAADGYSWGLSLRRDPARKSGANGDPLREAAKNVIERGDFTRIFGDGTVVVHLSGDIHRFASVQLTIAKLISCAPGTDTDPYGERGFSPNNVGNLVFGLPKHGPSAGPIKVIPFNHDFVRQYLLKPWKVDWDGLFVNPV